MVKDHHASGHRIVVGVDGSPSSGAALDWAVRQASLTGATIQAVTAWHYPTVVGGYAWGPLAVIESANFEEIATKMVSRVVADLEAASNVNISIAVRKGNAAQILIDESRGADLLVVGSRGHGGFSGALLGSVSLNCAHHASCPVVIVRDGKAPEVGESS